jgi:hypothetical protein
VLGDGLRLVESLESTVHALVEAPVLDNGKVPAKHDARFPPITHVKSEEAINGMHA